MRARWTLGVLPWVVIGSAVAQERTAFAKDPAFFAKRASAFGDALASGDMKRVLAFQPRGGADMPREARPQFQKIVDGFREFFATPAGGFHRAVFAAFPHLTQLPADLEWVEIEEQLRIPDPNAPTFLHALSFNLRFLWDEPTKAWVVEGFHVEFESVDTVSGITTPERDLVGASLTAVLDGLASGAPLATVLRTAKDPYAATILDAAHAERAGGTGSGALVTALARAIQAKDLSAVVARFDVDREAFAGKQTVFETRLAAHPDLERRLRELPALGELSGAVHRAALRFGAPSIEGGVEVVRGDAGFVLSSLHVQPAGENAFRLPTFLHRL